MNNKNWKSFQIAESIFKKGSTIIEWSIKILS